MTGNLGTVMKESATIALEYIKSNADIFGIDPELLSKYNGKQNLLCLPRPSNEKRNLRAPGEYIKRNKSSSMNTASFHAIILQMPNPFMASTQPKQAAIILAASAGM